MDYLRPACTTQCGGITEPYLSPRLKLRVYSSSNLALSLSHTSCMFLFEKKKKVRNLYLALEFNQLPCFSYKRVFEPEEKVLLTTN